MDFLRQLTHEVQGVTAEATRQSFTFNISNLRFQNLRSASLRRRLLFKQSKLALAALCLALFILGCSEKENPTSSTGGGGAHKRLRLAFVSNNSATFWTYARTGCLDAAKEMGD